MVCVGFSAIHSQTHGVTNALLAHEAHRAKERLHRRVVAAAVGGGGGGRALGRRVPARRASASSARRRPSTAAEMSESGRLPRAFGVSTSVSSVSVLSTAAGGRACAKCAVRSPAAAFGPAAACRSDDISAARLRHPVVELVIADDIAHLHVAVHLLLLRTWSRFDRRSPGSRRAIGASPFARRVPAHRREGSASCRRLVVAVDATPLGPAPPPEAAAGEAAAAAAASPCCCA